MNEATAESSFFAWTNVSISEALERQMEYPFNQVPSQSQLAADRSYVSKRCCPEVRPSPRNTPRRAANELNIDGVA